MEHDSFNELIWHFIGYLRTNESIATVRLEYDGGDSSAFHLQIGAFQSAGQISPVDDQDIDPLHQIGLPELISDRAGIFDPASYIPARLHDDIDTRAIIDSIPVTHENPISLPPMPDTPDSFTISLFYRIFPTLTYVFNAESANHLIDNDLLVANSVDLSTLGFSTLEEFLDDFAASMPGEEEIAALVDLANDEMPSFLAFEGDALDDGSLEDAIEQLAEALALRSKMLATQAQETGEGEGVQPDMTDNRGASNDDLEPGMPVSAEDAPTQEGQGSSGGAQEEGESEPLPDQFIHLGSNETVNVASIVDTSEAGASMIVLGDYFETNVIVQANIYSFNDNENISTILADGGALGETNYLLNDADTARMTGDAVVPAPIGFSLPAYNFHVDYVFGDFFDLNILNQMNDLTDNDALVYETHTQNYLIETGNNTLVNAAQILDLYMQYDLIVVAGTYNEVNFIKQTNIVLDSDNVRFGGAFADQFIADGNVLHNDATIRNIGGGELFKPITSDIELIAESIANFEPSLTFLNDDIDFGMALNTPSEVNVLYVTGDFYQLNAIFQTNILKDIDAGLIIDGKPNNNGALQNVNAADADGPGKPVYATGDNLASNEATIIDYDSQSAFQYLGGELYEQDVLIQVNLVVPEDDASEMAANGAPDQLVNEVIAFTGPAETLPAGDPNNELFVPHHGAADGGDMMGTMMA